jgi:transposase
VAKPRSVVMGCDSHKLTVACGIVDQVGQEVATAAFTNGSEGFRRVLEWLLTLEVVVVRVGIEGSANYGRHLATFLTAQGMDVREVPPIRTAQQRNRRRRPKSDREDAIAIAKEVLADDRLPVAKPAMAVSDVQAELAVISDRRRSLMRRRQRLLNEVEMLLVKLPTAILEQIPGRTIAGRLRKLCHLDVAARISLQPLRSSLSGSRIWHGILAAGRPRFGNWRRRSRSWSLSAARL